SSGVDSSQARCSSFAAAATTPGTAPGSAITVAAGSAPPSTYSRRPLSSVPNAASPSRKDTGSHASPSIAPGQSRGVSSHVSQTVGAASVLGAVTDSLPSGAGQTSQTTASASAPASVSR